LRDELITTPEPNKSRQGFRPAADASDPLYRWQ